MTAVNHNLGKVAVLFGGVSAEREVSIKSGTMSTARLFGSSSPIAASASSQR